MTAQFLRADDPRSPLQKATRYELIAYARANNVADAIVAVFNRQIDNIPADLLRDELRARGLTRPPIRNRILGMPTADHGAAPATAAGPEIDAMADLRRQFLAQAAPPPPSPAPSAPPPAAAPTKRLEHMDIVELGREMKRLGIHRDRRDNMIIMREKIASHGQNPA